MMIAKDKIAEVLHESKTAEDFATYAACRERNAREGISSISYLRRMMQSEGFDPVPEDLREMFRGLQEIGVGKLQGDSFKWNLPITKVGQAVAKTSKPPTPIVPKSNAVAPRTSLIPDSKQTLVMYYPGGKEIVATWSCRLTPEEMTSFCEKMLAAIR